MGLVAYIHGWVDFFLSWGKLVQNREIGWLTVDRKTGKFMREQQPLWKKIKLLLLFNPLLEWIDRTKLLRFVLHEKATHAGKVESSPASKKKIKSFVDFYKIDMSLFEPEDINAYPSFQDFFIRRHKPGVRPIHKPDDSTAAIVVADCRLVVYDTVPHARSIWIKGHNFTIKNLIQDDTEWQRWHNGSVASFRLSPQDYHRFHSPVTGRIKWCKRIAGDYYGVDPICIRSDIDVLTSNARCAVVIVTQDFGEVLFVAIGAKEVGTVKIHERFHAPGMLIHKGDELGMFEFGGSSIIVAFEPGRIEFDDDLVYHSNRAIEVDVEMGMSLGKATKPGVGARGYQYAGKLKDDVPGTGSEAGRAARGGRSYKDVLKED
ncbi:phosphatidylserine decarboxylase-domain-containing protein [Kalaharituber pfeilii]|nr:phosphatidylserine decarboxylase-domain-containing protein [Kalaharituber pfeilii]